MIHKVACTRPHAGSGTALCCVTELMKNTQSCAGRKDAGLGESCVHLDVSSRVKAVQLVDDFQHSPLHLVVATWGCYKEDHQKEA